ncbi:MAG: HlyD family secretion protein [Planctomycetota bacterium]
MSDADSTSKPSPAPAQPRRWAMTPRRWTAAIVGCLLLLLVFYAAIDHYAPHTSDAYLQAYVVQVAPQVNGRVTRVAVEDDAQVKAGDLLFEIDARPYAYEVAVLEAEMAQAQSQVIQLELEVDAANEQLKATSNHLDFVKQVWEKTDELYQGNSASYREWIEARDEFLQTQATLEKTKADLSIAKAAATAEIDDVHVLIRRSEAALSKARFDLAQTKVYASVDGTVTNLQLREGSYVQEGDQVMTVVDSEQWWVVANYMENALARMKPGQAAELSLGTRPGRVFPGKVLSIARGVSEGQGTPSGDLESVENPTYWVQEPQRLPVRVAFDDLDDVGSMRVGVTVQVTVYTTRGNPLNLIGMFWQRVTTWLDFIY